VTGHFSLANQDLFLPYNDSSITCKVLDLKKCPKLLAFLQHGNTEALSLVLSSQRTLYTKSNKG
jgi:hypothetical protein